MTREEYFEKVKQIIITKNLAGNIHENNFRKYDYGQMTPINSNIINSLRKENIILNEEVYLNLLKLQKLTSETNEEFKFILLGKETENQIEFNNFIIYNDYPILNKSIFIALWNELKKDKNSKIAICLGHTNSSTRDFEENFTLGDFTDYIISYQENLLLKKYQIEVIGCILTNSNDMNFILFDNINNNFHKFINVLVKNKNEQFITLNCFNPKEQVKRFLKKN